jgi:hypothetical protein
MQVKYARLAFVMQVMPTTLAEYEAYRNQIPFLVGGSDEDPFEHRQVTLAQERLGNKGLAIT